MTAVEFVEAVKLNMSKCRVIKRAVCSGNGEVFYLKCSSGFSQQIFSKTAGKGLENLWSTLLFQKRLPNFPSHFVR